VATEDKSTRYHRLRRRASIVATAAGGLFLAAAVLTGGAAWLRDALVAPGQQPGVWATLAYAALLTIAYHAVRLPALHYRGLTLERRYGLSTESARHWWLGEAKALAVSLPAVALMALVLTTLVRWSPGHWWLLAAAAATLGLVVAAHVVPTVLLPAFFDLTPLDRPALTARLVALADRCGAPVLGVFEWRVGDRTRKAAASLVGVGASRRILVSDTLLADHPDDEIEVILAHELSHQVHHDVWTSIAVQGVLMLAGCYLAQRMLTALAPALELSGPADLAALPLVALAAGAVSAGLMPVANALSRAQERRADRYAVAVTRNAAALVSALRRIGATNLAEDQPSRVVEALFHTHPSPASRMAAAQAALAAPAPAAAHAFRTRRR
jgi:STE24 endopeptidase